VAFRLFDKPRYVNYAPCALGKTSAVPAASEAGHKSVHQLRPFRRATSPDRVSLQARVPAEMVSREAGQSLDGRPPRPFLARGQLGQALDIAVGGPTASLGAGGGYVDRA
jgi:hypothetical protein